MSILKANYHTHTSRCRHAYGTEKEYIENAIGGGLRILGFSDHAPYPFPGDYRSGFRMEINELDDYVNTVLSLKEEYKEKIEIHLGLEAEYYPSYFDSFRRLISDYPIEYLLLGQHFLYDEIGAPYSGAATDSPKLLEDYCSQVVAALNTGCFTYLAHPDLFNFTGSRGIYRQEMQRICKEALALNIPLELNVLGFSDRRNYPDNTFWETAAEIGNTVIIGCDAHCPENTLRPDEIERMTEIFIKPLGLKLTDSPDFKKFI